MLFWLSELGQVLLLEAHFLKVFISYCHIASKAERDWREEGSRERDGGEERGEKIVREGERGRG